MLAMPDGKASGGSGGETAWNASQRIQEPNDQGSMVGAIRIKRPLVFDTAGLRIMFRW
jgi:hypothetical protein